MYGWREFQTDFLKAKRRDVTYETYSLTFEEIKTRKSSPYIVNRVYKTIYKYELDGHSFDPAEKLVTR